MKSAAQLALDERVNTNIIGIAKTIFDDIPGMESIGFQTAVQSLRSISTMHTPKLRQQIQSFL
jgi:6-phosphofructokinase